MGAQATGFPLLPSQYTAGTITLPDTAAHNLLTLILAQLDANAIGAAQEVTIQADASGPLYVGADKNLVGVLSTTNYGYVLDKAQAGFLAGASRTYRSGFPGHGSPIASVFVLGGTSQTFHVEIIPG